VSNPVPADQVWGFADRPSLERAIDVLTWADEERIKQPFGGAGGDRLLCFGLVVPTGSPPVDGSTWCAGKIWKFNDSDTADAMGATEGADCYLRDLWLKKLPDGGPILFGLFTGRKVVPAIDATQSRPTFRTLTPWPIKKQRVITQIGCSGSTLQYTYKDVWVIDYAGT
jgi:hypothetical protein